MGKKSILISILIVVGVLSYFVLRSFIGAGAPVDTQALEQDQEAIPASDIAEDPQVPQQALLNSAPKRNASSASTMLHSSEGSFLKTRKLPESYQVQKSRKIQNVATESLRSHPWLNDKGFKIWIGKRAVLGSDSEVRVGNYGIEDGEASTIESFRLDNPIPVYDESTQSAGVLTGQFEVTFDSPNAAIDVSYEGVRVLTGVPQAGVIYMTSENEPFDLRILQAFLEEQPHVKNVKPIVRSRSREKY